MTNPKITFVIPTYNTLELTKACLKSLAETVNLDEHETILVDDASTDGTPAYLAHLPSPFTVILNPANQGYANNCNHAARLAHGDILCLCNSDLVFLPGWLPPLLQALETLPSAGIVGNIQRRVTDLRIDHAGVKFFPDGRPRHLAHGAKHAPLKPHLPVSAVTAACCLIRKDLFLAFHGFNEKYRNGFEDTDLCLRLDRAGYRHYVCTRSLLLHHVSASPGRKSHEDSNLVLFLQLWKETAMRISKREQTQWYLLETVLPLHPWLRLFLYLQPFIRYF